MKRAEVVEVILEDHPNADLLSLVRLFGYTVVVRTEDFRNKARGIYISPDNVVPDTKRFSWLKHRRIKATKIRGQISYGLLVPLTEEEEQLWETGAEVSEVLGITNYVPPISFGRSGKGNSVSGPPGVIAPKYDIENYRRWPEALIPGEEVRVTEKVHGANARYVLVGGKMWCGSRTQWKEQNTTCPWWSSLTLDMRAWCRSNDGVVLYGEIYGRVQDLKYSVDGIQFVAFDVFRSGRFDDVFDREHLCAWNIPDVPELYWGNLPKEADKILPFLEELTRQSSVLDLQIRNSYEPQRKGSQIMEGIVIEPVVPREHPKIGRVKLKLVGEEYLLKGK